MSEQPARAADRVPRRSRRRLAAGLAALAAALVAVGVILADNLGGGGKSASADSPVTGAATVTRRTLIATDTESGTLGYANPQTVYDRLSGTITWLPAVGQVINPGQALYQVDGQPVVLFNGTFPAYRDLGPDVSDGPDVLQLNQDLVKMGFADGQITVNDIWQAGTTDAVERWQGSVGESETGTIAFGQIVFLPGAQRITEVNTTLGSDGSPSSSGSGSPSGSSDTAADRSESAARPEFVSLTTTSAGAQPSVESSPGASAVAARASCEGAGASPFSATTTPPTSTAAPRRNCGGTTKSGGGPAKSRGGAGKSSLTAEELQALIALLKAETLALQKSKASPSSPTRGTGGGSGTGSPSGRGGSAGKGGGSGGGSGGGASGNGGAGTGGSGSGSGSGAGGSGGAGNGSGAGGSGSGSSGGSAQAILETTSSQLVVTVDLDASKQSEAVVGAPVMVEMPDGSSVNGKITQVSSVAQSNSNSGSGSGGGQGSSSSPSATVPVTITLSGHHSGAGLDQAAVSVSFEQQVAPNVLAVPVTALLATQGGGYAVQDAAAPHALIPVTTGVFAAGYVQISGSGIHPGLQVTDSQG